MFRYSVSMKHMASWIATGVSCTRLVTSPSAQMLGTLVREYASTMMAPTRLRRQLARSAVT